MLARASFLILLLLTFSFGPGFFVVRRLRWTPLEKLSGSIALSLTLIFLLTFGAYWARLPSSASLYGITAICGGLTLLGLRDAWRLVRSPRMAAVLIPFGILAAWTLGAQSLIRHYSGGDWCGVEARGAGCIVESDRRAIAACCQVGKAFAALALALGTAAGLLNREAMLAILLLSGTARAFELPTMHALVPSLVPLVLLPRAIAASASAQQTAVICGPSLGGVLYGLGPAVVYATCTVIFILAGV
jgi:hypothetical protein